MSQHLDKMYRLKCSSVLDCNHLAMLLVVALLQLSVRSTDLPVSRVTTCPSAEEGKMYVVNLDCESNDQSYWQLLPKSEGPPKNCTHSDGLTCDWAEFGHVTVSTKNNGMKNLSTLKIHSVSPIWRNQTIQCLSSELEGRSFTDMTQCRMDTFHKPESVECQVSRLRRNHLQIMCKTARIYPKLNCTVIQRDNTNLVNTDMSQIFEYKNEILPNLKAIYYASSCSGEIINLSPGTYQYFAALTPVINFDGYVRNLSVVVKPIEVNIPPADHPMVTLSLESSPKISCPNTQTTLIFICRARNFESLPTFEWFLWEPKFRQSQNICSFRSGSLNGTVYISSCSFLVDAEHVGQLVVCSAGSDNLMVNNSFQIHKHLFGTLVPVFSLSNDQEINGTLAITQDTIHSVTCRVKQDNQDIHLLQVRCVKNFDTILSRSFSALNITFVLKGSTNFDGSNCSCNVIHQCYNLSTHIVIKVYPVQSSTDGMMVKQSSISYNFPKAHPIVDTSNALTTNIKDSTWILYTFVSVVGFLFLICVLYLTVMSARDRRRQQTRTDRRYHLYEVVR